MNPMLASSYKNQSIDGWLLSEKLDGVRAIWTGSELVSRNGNKFNAPEWFISKLPCCIALDGELFAGRGKFQSTLSVIKKRIPVDAEWRQIRFCVFDAPECRAGFVDRLAFCHDIIEICANVEIVDHYFCNDKSDLQQLFNKLVADGAEGVMIRDPFAPYEFGERSKSLLKYKPRSSAEAVVVGAERGTGRLANSIGALIVQWGEVVFRIGAGLCDEIRNNPPSAGALVTFDFMGVTDAGCPRFPTFVAVRDYE